MRVRLWWNSPDSERVSKLPPYQDIATTVPL